MPLKQRVFVYGTLRAGGSNHRLLTAGRCLGTHWTEPRYTMLDCGAYPGVVMGGTHAIHGEVYQVTPRIMAQLDRLEDYPRSYDRSLLETPWGGAWIYIFRPGAMCLPTIPGGDWMRRR
ncbi:gamma-glutamylcyclotransferase (GGCT)/AIG2-like uncharacterized protein YtfP [Natronocella acetinitrilica]|uniref:Gamma-glutamylcyclotransferase family protein n=1 Tax=Natronocella acetinitrilica TaxID=414046 RepID=A0AAE3G4C7_9GAMM|nr:gamma-glutamylcyclotransferase family protein [Natronocella acetinitrilica]MCP1675571.1 gamma-glutamylcyclotransferase (GGCT)/AIG2-like uncharacterized protein YtfP [Natronocella acetinitrilica]